MKNCYIKGPTGPKGRERLGVIYLATFEGIITINDNSIPYELVNLAKTTLYLKTPNIANLNTNSYFVNAPLTIIIDEIISNEQIGFLKFIKKESTPDMDCPYCGGTMLPLDLKN